MPQKDKRAGPPREKSSNYGFTLSCGESSELVLGAEARQGIMGCQEIDIAENGCGATDELTPDGKVFDTDRVMFMKNYLA